MKTRASLKKRTPDCKIVRRKGRLYKMCGGLRKSS